MASLKQEIVVAADADFVWDAARDVGALATRLVPGFVTEARLEGRVRIVTFANAVTLREPIVALDDRERRLAWSAEGGAASHYNASLQAFPIEGGGCRIVWIADFLPDEIAPRIEAAMRAGAEAMRARFAVQR